MGWFQIFGVDGELCDGVGQWALNFVWIAVVFVIVAVEIRHGSR